MPFLDSENAARGAKKGNKPRVLHNAIVVLLAMCRYKRGTRKVNQVCINMHLFLPFLF